MGMEPKIYTILGYDFSPWYDQMYTEEWSENYEHDKWIDNWTPGQVQLFTDLSGGEHLYFGYILAAGDGYNWVDQKEPFERIKSLSNFVAQQLLQSDLKLPTKNFPPMSIITFVEWV